MVTIHLDDNASRAELAAEIARLCGALADHIRSRDRRGAALALHTELGALSGASEALALLAESAAEWEGTVRRWHQLVPTVKEAGLENTALRRAARAFDLGPVEYEAVVLALAPELDDRISRCIAYANSVWGQSSRPTLGLAVAMSMRSVPDERRLSVTDLRQRPFIRDGLIILEGSGPLSTRTMRIPDAYVQRLSAGPELSSDQDHLPSVYPADPGLVDRLALTKSVRDASRCWATAVRRQRAAQIPLLIVGSPGSGRTSVARAASSGAGYSLVVVNPTEALPQQLRTARTHARWHHAAVLVKIPSHSTIEPKVVWSGLATLEHPVLLALAPESVESFARCAPADPIIVRLTGLSHAMRGQLLRALIPHKFDSDVTDVELDELATRFRFGPGALQRAVRRATTDAILRREHERKMTTAVIEKALRNVGSGEMGPLADKLPLPYTRADLVVPPAIGDELELARAWVEQRSRVLETWGFARRVPAGHGLTALFSGRPGTGKTMAAQVLAAELGLDLYRIDLSRVVSKYIGETEKNLARIFEQARAAGVVLLFDEADALFGKRSEVRDAHDRYANIEISYLLQRMEDHDGVTILTTNRKRDLDGAFLRRFFIAINFPVPCAADRLRIWQGMIPADAHCDADLGFEQLAESFELSGGAIKNVVLTAAYFAAAEHDPVGRAHIGRALERELTKSGIVADDRMRRALEQYVA